MPDSRVDLAIVGGGAAGLTAAITAARQLKSRRGVHIVVLERLDRVGKKLLATVNGRCNLTHADAGIDSYHGRDPRFALGALRRFDSQATVAFFRELGMLCRTEADGRVFPYSLQANTVLDTLRQAAARHAVELRTGFEVARIEPAQPLYIGNEPLTDGTGFELFSTTGEHISARRVIVTAGGCASPALGSNGSGFALLQALGHELVPPRPAIVHITTETAVVKPLTGIKVQGRARLFEGSREIGAEDGEILFTDDGLSGPPILQLARLVSERVASPDKAEAPSGETDGKSVAAADGKAAAPADGKAAAPPELHVVLDLMPEYDAAALVALLAEFTPATAGLTLADVLNGFLHKKLAATVVRLALSRPLTEPAASLAKPERQLLAAMIKNMPVRVTGTRGFAFAQVTAGGIATAGFRPDTLESRLVPGLYAAGEVLDIDGDCGGFNLQWAWASGVLAASRAANALLQADEPDSGKPRRGEGRPADSRKSGDASRPGEAGLPGDAWRKGGRPDGGRPGDASRKRR